MTNISAELAAEIRAALTATERGETEDLGSFAQYADAQDNTTPLTVTCPHCGATAGQRCMMTSDWARQPHAARIRAAEICDGRAR